MDFPAKEIWRRFPVEECPDQAATRMAMWVHFLYWHVLDTMVILEEETPHPPTVPLMRHSGPLARTEWQAPCYSSVRQGSGVKEAAVSGGGAKGELVEGLRGIRGAAGKYDGV